MLFNSLSVLPIIFVFGYQVKLVFRQNYFRNNYVFKKSHMIFFKSFEKITLKKVCQWYFEKKSRMKVSFSHNFCFGYQVKLALDKTFYKQLCFLKVPYDL